MQWLRWHHGTVSDPKWRLVSRRSGQPVHAVLAVWAAMLESASGGDQRGELEGWDDEVVGIGLDMDTDAVIAIRSAMQGLVLEGDTLTGWGKRNPKREDDSSERVRRYRERQKNVTPGNAGKRDVTLDEIDKREEIEQKKDADASLSGAGAPAEPDPVRLVFDHWQQASGHTKARCTEDRKRKIRARLGSYSADQLCRAIDGACSNPFYRGDNDRGERYDWVETILKNDAVVDRHLDYDPSQNGARAGPKHDPEQEFRDKLERDMV